MFKIECKTMNLSCSIFFNKCVLMIANKYNDSAKMQSFSKHHEFPLNAKLLIFRFFNQCRRQNNKVNS